MRTRTDPMRSRWFMPSFTLAIGAIVAVAFAVGGQPLWMVLFAIALFGAIAAVFAFARRSETIQGIGGPGRDERWAAIDLHATAITGGVLAFAVIVAWLVEIVNGHDGSPYTWLGALGGATYVVSVLVLRARR
jgi:hypothetical protein